MPQIEPHSNGSNGFRFLALAVFVVIAIVGYLKFQGLRDERLPPAPEASPPVANDSQEPVVPVVSAMEVTRDSAPALWNRLQNWSGLIRVDVTPAKLESSLAFDKSVQISQLRNDELEVVKISPPGKNGTLRNEQGRLVLSIDEKVLEGGTASRSTLSCPVGRADSLIEIRPDVDGTVWVGEHCYRGDLRIVLVQEKVRIINVVPLEDYLASVVDSEMPATFSISGRQAQAIVARSYALYHLLTAPKDAVSDVTDSTRHQRYLGYQYRSKDGRRLAGETKAGRKIAESTRGIVCLHQNDLLLTYFSACCGGETNRLPRMYREWGSAYRRQNDPYCQKAPVHQWVERLSPDQFIDEIRHVEADRNWGDIFKGISRAGKVSDGTFDLELAQGRHQSITAERLQRVFALKSPFFDIEAKDGGGVTIRGEGHGHSVGLCQWGANFAGQQGKSAEEILNFYFDNMELRRLPN